MKTTTIYKAGHFTEKEKLRIKNLLTSYCYIPKDEDETNRFHQAILERRQLRKQAKAERQANNFNQNEK